MVSGMVKVSGMPFEAATKARAMPVLPLVGSISSLPGPSKPSFSAWAIMAAPMRHFTE